MENIDRQLEELVLEIQQAAKKYRETRHRGEREKYAQIYEAKKAELETLKEESREILSNCCAAKIIMHDAQYHGKCNECFENCTP